MSSDVLELVITRKLESANVTRGYHWRRWHRETQWWQALINVAAGKVHDFKSWVLVVDVEMRQDARGHYRPKEVRHKERRRVSVIRLVKGKRQFIKDDDNLRFAVKPLNDALKRLGLIYDDKREWLDQPMPEQGVSPDGIARTIVRIERTEVTGGL